MNSILTLIFALVVLIWGLSLDANNELQGSLIEISIGLFIAFTINVIILLVQNWGRFLLLVQTKLFQRKQSVRFSMSYLFRIKVNDRYLLVKNNNWDFFQLVGGKYKRHPETQKILKDFNAVDDLKMPTDGLKKNDLAVFVPAPKAVEFLDWFNSKKERELSQWREFYEELIKTKVLSVENFPYVDYRYAGTVRTPLKTAPAWQCLEILQYEIYDLLPNKEQELELKKLFDKGDTDYIKWATIPRINTFGYDENLRRRPYRIGDHTKWAINLKWSKS